MKHLSKIFSIVVAMLGIAAALLSLTNQTARTRVAAAALASASDLPKVTVSGHVFGGETGDKSHPVGGHPVALISGSVQHAARTAEDGSFSFNEVAIPAGLSVRVVAEGCDGCAYSEPVIAGGSLTPSSVLPLEAAFPSCANYEGCAYPKVDFFIQQPDDNQDSADSPALARRAVKVEAAPKSAHNLALAPLATSPVSAASVVDVTAVTDQQISGPVTSWQTQDGIYKVEHLAGRNLNGELIVFYWSPRDGDWRSVNVSQVTGHKITGRVTSWLTSDGSYTVEHLAGRNVFGDLIVFYWSPRNGDWRAVNVSQKTGQKILGAVTSWQTPDGSYNVEHLAGANPSGDLIVFYWSPAKDWQAVNVSQKTGRKVANTPASWQVRSGGVLTEYLAARGSDAALYVFSWAPGRDWDVNNISQITGQKIIGNVTSWQTGNVQHLAGTGPDNALITFWRTPSINWSAVNVSSITGEYVSGEPTVYQLRDGVENVEVLGAKSREGQILVFWWKPSRDWQSFNLSEVTGKDITSVPAGWLTQDGGQPVEHLAAAGTDHHLLVFWGFAQPRQLTDAVGRPFASLKRMRNIRRKVLTILWDPKRPGHPAPPADEVEAKLFGADSVRSYFNENSNSYFTIEKAGVKGWYTAKYNGACTKQNRICADHYWQADQEDLPEDRNSNGVLDAGEDLNGNGKLDGPDGLLQADEDRNKNGKLDYDLNGDGWIYGAHEKWAEAIRAAAAEPNFHLADYDANRNGILEPSELAIIVVIPQNSDYGTVRVPPGREAPNWEALKVDGVIIPKIMEWYAVPASTGLPAHELSHLLLDHGDMYIDSRPTAHGFTSVYAPGTYSLMDQTYFKTHLDPIAKLKFGWLRPKIIFRSGLYKLDAVATSHKVWILMDPARGADEYFIVENRWRGSGSYELNLNDQGLAVWHVMERPDVYGSIAAPPGVTQVLWDSKVSPTDWTRRAIRLLRPAPLFGSIRELWDESEYDLLSSDPDPEHMTLRWADGTPSGFSLRSISAAGATMEATIGIP